MTPFLQNAVVCSSLVAVLATTTIADINFVQTVDQWALNTYAWNLQNETITLPPNLGALVGDTKDVWARVVQKNGSQAGTAVFCTTMTKTAAGLVDTWSVVIPAGSITDKDFWDANVLCVELVKCDRRARKGYKSVPIPDQPNPVGHAGLVILPGLVEPDVGQDASPMRGALDSSDWLPQGVADGGFDFAVYVYQDPFFPFPIILNHFDPLALSTFLVDDLDAFGTGLPFQPDQLLIMGVELDPNWALLPKVSNGLLFFDWQLNFKEATLFTDQGNFGIVRLEPLIAGWEFICPADYNEDGALNFLDISLFLQLYGELDPAADFNGDGQFNFLDISGFLKAYSEGCNPK